MAKFTIVLAEYAHRAVFADVADLLTFGFQALGHEVDRSTVPTNKGTDIILAPHLLRAAMGDNAVLEHVREGTIIYNFEPTESRLFAASMPLLHRTGLRTWDYSWQGTEKLRELGVDARHVPLGYAPELERLSLESPLWDVLFYGSLCERRARVLQECEAKGLRVKHLFNVYGSDRDWHIERSKLVLNVHYYPSAPTEDVRLIYLAANRVCVVSEGPPDERRKLSWCIWSDYEELGVECAWLARASDSARRQIGQLCGDAFCQTSRPQAHILCEALSE